MATNPEDLRRWVAGYRAVNERVLQERRSLTPAASLRKALEVRAFTRRVSGEPPPTSTDEILEVHAIWDKLRAALLTHD